MNTTLVVMAAGMGSRFGGLKQLTPLTDDEEFIIDFTVYDAIRAGFEKIIFIIKEENLNILEIKLSILIGFDHILIQLYAGR